VATYFEHFDHFDDRARKAVQLANQEAQRFNHNEVDSAHILLGLIKEGTSEWIDVWREHGIDLRKMRYEIEKRITPGADKYISAINKFNATYDANPNNISVLKSALDEFLQAREDFDQKKRDLIAKRSDEGVRAEAYAKKGYCHTKIRGGVYVIDRGTNDNYDPSLLRKFKKEGKKIDDIEYVPIRLWHSTGVSEKWKAIEEFEKEST